MDNKTIGRPKKFTEAKSITFKLEAEDYFSLKDLAASCGETISDLLVEYVTGLVAANAQKIKSFRRQKNTGVKATFATPSKPTRTSKKKIPAQVTESVTGDGLKGGEDIAEN